MHIMTHVVMTHVVLCLTLLVALWSQERAVAAESALAEQEDWATRWREECEALRGACGGGHLSRCIYSC